MEDHMCKVIVPPHSQFLLVLVLAFVACAPHASTLTLTPEESAYLEKVKSFPLEFSITKEEEDQAWGRAESFVAQYRMTDMDPPSKYSIRTKRSDPRKFRTSVSYEITKIPTADGFTIKVQCFSGESGAIKIGPDSADKDAITNAHILAYYIKTGELPYPRLIRTD